MPRPYEYLRIKRRFLPWAEKEPGNSPESMRVEPGIEKTDQAADVSVTSMTNDGDGGITIISEESV